MASKRAIVRQSLPDAIASDIRERILNGELAEGLTIRQEALAEEYGVSRMPVREALKRLDAEGLVQLTNNLGATVTKHSLDEIGEIFDLRILIEVDLFRRAIAAMTPAHLKRCEEILETMETSYDADDVGKWGSLNFEYHSALYAAANRGLTNDVLHRINLQSDRYVRMHLSVMEQRDPATREHRELLELARAGKTEEACAQLTQHIAQTKTNLLKLMVDKRADEDCESLSR
ncbi:GntR family transcriptional regulator [Labrenzia sp. 011]|uniref:GntR family transcriptional regulator n=1 Tax=Labrenzia sp. 011 TaxID=2171494 RepID=UPI000D515A60|nr:GntR family transcriptional regulator [Labrenzia sp. 011]PVB63438.1 GntR family transcriptional regulator [Labrenzia sp. 011]